MTTTLFLIRHAQTESNVNGYYMMGWNDVELNEFGRLQAESLALRLAHQPIETIYASPLKRAFRTAEIIAEPHNLSPQKMSGLMEMNYGDWQGLKRTEIRQRYPEQWRRCVEFDPDMRYPNGESYRELAERSIQVYNEIASTADGKLVAAVSHQGFLRVMVMHILGATHQVCSKIEFANASLSVIKITNGIPRLVTLNDMSHLEYFKKA